MFKQVKSALFWYYLYKFRRKVILISFLLLVALFANAIYDDIIQYLTLKDKLEYLEIAIIIKWSIIIFNILFSILLILRVFKSTESKKINEKEIKKAKNNDIIKNDEKKSSKFTKREEEFLKKDLLKNKADILVER
ncbi:hypothetical protein [Arcobacter sp. LA11]|uniref:hypothetical protein n=1 Tax=Arcobacter sp. LA11 TaxID=1898176 RepID=UPI000933C9F6|nr:hypothetical protein [Arcobacter sp. LA11]